MKGPNSVFLASLALPVDPSAAGAALRLAEQVAEQLDLAKSMRHDLSLATEEAFLNAATHFSSPASHDERIYVEFSIEDDALVISVRERGIPFRFNETRRYNADDPEAMELPGLGSLLMRRAMDQVEYFVHGRDGKETRMRKRLPPDAVPPPRAPKKRARGADRRTLTDVTVREPTEEELAAVCQLAWRCYGYSQESFLYVEETLREKIAAGLFRSLIAIDEASGQIVGHSGLKYMEAGSRTPEACAVFLDPTFRLPGVSAKLSQELYEMGRRGGMVGWFDSSVTTHPLSQKISQNMGGVPCCLMLGIAAAGMKVRELATTTQPKGSVINHYFAEDRAPREVFAPPRHWEMMRGVYDQMKLPRALAQPGVIDTESSACSLIHLPEELKAAFIIVHRIGPDAFTEIAAHLRACRMNRLDAVYAFLSLGDPRTPELSEQCEQVGFSFAGVMPHIHDDDDRLLLQFVNIPIDMEKIRVHGPQAKALFDYVRSERERLL